MQYGSTKNVGKNYMGSYHPTSSHNYYEEGSGDPQENQMYDDM